MAELRWTAGPQSGGGTAEAGTGLMEALHKTGAPLEFPCGGRHTCGKCRVLASGALSPVTEEERRLLGDAPAGTRLACFARILGDCRVRLPGRAGEQIAMDFSAGDMVLSPIYDGGWGAAFDIGTTTVVGYLFRHDSAQPVAVLGEMNRQRRYGADVLSRIDYAAQHTVEPRRALICGQLSDMLLGLCGQAGVERGQIRGLCVTGNTTMLHLAAGLDPHSLSQAPFRPQSLFGGMWDLRLPDFPGLAAYLPPCVSAYVGADITCSILTSGILDAPETRLLVDVGTNGEMALRTADGLFCCATAAGPAFEGAGISCGSSACAGAISRAALRDGAPVYTVQGGGEAKSLCGSGLIDTAACLLQTGAIDYRGRVRKDLNGVIPLTGTVSLTQMDVRQLQLAKGAIRAGMDALLDAAGLDYDQLEEIIFCGGFGSYLDPASAEAIGLIPAGTAARTRAIGNAAGAGAGRLLQSRPLADKADRIAAQARVVELSTSKFFQKQYIASMNFPRPEHG